MLACISSNDTCWCILHLLFSPNQLYKRGPFALAVNFYKSVPERRRTQDAIELRQQRDSDARKQKQKQKKLTSSPTRSVVAKTSKALSPTVRTSERPKADVQLKLLEEGAEGDDSDDRGDDEVGNDSGEHVSESDIEAGLEELDVNEMLRSGHYKEGEKDDTAGFLPQLFTADERNRTDLYKPRRSLPWSVFYLAAGVGGPGALAVFLLLWKVRTACFSVWRRTCYERR
jgi:hypothetical protein